MRTVATCGGLLLLLLVLLFMAAAFVVARRSPDAGPSPASILARGDPALGEGAGGPDPPGTDPPAAVTGSRPLVARGPPARASGLVLATSEIDLGDVDPGERVHLAVPWRRDDEDGLRVREVRTACGCLAATGLFGPLPAGARGTLSLLLHVPSRPGPFYLSVRVITDRPGESARVDVRGFCGHAPSVAPAALDMGTVALGREVERLVSVRLPAAAGDAAVSARLVGAAGTVSVHPPLGRRPGPDPAAERGAEVLVRLPCGKAGLLEGTLEVAVGDRERLRIPVRGWVAGR